MRFTATVCNQTALSISHVQFMVDGWWVGVLASCAHKCVAVFKSLEEALQDLETPADFEWNQAAAVAYFLFFIFSF